jgi:signal transduction histidine kinase
VPPDGDAAVPNGSSRMLRFVGQVLDAALLRSGTSLNLQVEPVNLSALVNGVLDEESAAHPSVRFVRETRVGFHVVGDAARLRQVVACLVGNARRHGAPDEAIVVQLHRHEGSIALEVSNVGNEIAPDVATSMFDPFRTPQGAIRADADGLGLSLYIARHVARAHGGELGYAYAEPYVLFTLTLVTAPQS